MLVPIILIDFHMKSPQENLPNFHYSSQYLRSNPVVKFYILELDYIMPVSVVDLLYAIFYSSNEKKNCQKSCFFMFLVRHYEFHPPLWVFTILIC